MHERNVVGMAQLAEFATNHPYLVSGLLAALMAVVFHELRLQSQGVTQVSALDAVRLINKGAIVIDVRDANGYGSGHIVNSKHMALETLDPAKPPLSKYQDKLLLVICDSGARSSKAANSLRKAGFDKVFSLKGGLAAWRAQNLPLVK
jgi:rhodanese-related sulfurtransferase